jgi:hypothetical protein
VHARGRVACVAMMAWLIAAAACTSSDEPDRTQPTKTAPASTRATTSAPRQEPGTSDRAIVRGRALLDGKPFDSRWVGAVVLSDGLVTPCQSTLPPVKDGRYSVPVFADVESSGCGAPGSQIGLWTFAHDKVLYSTDTVAWPGNGRTTTFAPRYSSAAPGGATPELAQFTGTAASADHEQLPPGTRVEAYVGQTRCGVASVRTTDAFTGYILAVVGPDSIAGCTRGAALSFRVNGRPASHAPAVNTPPGQRDSLDRTLR